MAKNRKTYLVEDDIDQKIEVVAAVEGKSKSEVVEEAFLRHLNTKGFLKALTKPRVRAAAAGGRNHQS